MANCTLMRPTTPRASASARVWSRRTWISSSAEGVGRQRAGGVAGVDAGLLDVLHDAADEHPRAVGDRVDVDLDRVLQELVDQDRMLGRHLHRLVHELAEVLLVVDDTHRAPAEHVGRAHEHRIADL